MSVVVSEGESDGSAENEALVLRVTVVLRVAKALPDPELVWEADAEESAVDDAGGLAELLPVPVTVVVWAALRVPLEDAEALALAAELAESAAVADADKVSTALNERAPVAELVPEAVAEAVPVAVAVAEALADAVRVAAADPEAVAVPDDPELSVAPADPDGVFEPEGVDDALRLDELVCVGETDAAAEAVACEVRLWVAEGVAEELEVEDAVALSE